MSFYIKPEEYFLTDFRRHGLLRHVARHRCECGKDCKDLAIELSQVFGGEMKGKRVMIQPHHEIMQGPRDRQITQMKIEQIPTRTIAAKYGLTVSRINQIIEKGLDRIWPTK